MSNIEKPDLFKQLNATIDSREAARAKKDAEAQEFHKRRAANRVAFAEVFKTVIEPTVTEFIATIRARGFDAKVIREASNQFLRVMFYNGPDRSPVVQSDHDQRPFVEFGIHDEANGAWSLRITSGENQEARRRRDAAKWIDHAPHAVTPKLVADALTRLVESSLEAAAKRPFGR